MNSELANNLLSAVMKWDTKRLAQERPILEFIGSMKYDAYDQFMPGSRFMASLVQWLSQFDNEDKEMVYNFVMNNLIFVSSSQMSYLIDLLYTMLMRPIIIDKSAKSLNINRYLVSKIESSDYFKIHKRLSLIVGLSDGAHMDMLRRSAGFNNDQVLTNYYPSDEKIQDMLKEIKNNEQLNAFQKSKFETLFLIDDFTASGTSFIRMEDDCYKGKLIKIIEDLINNERNENKKTLKDLFDKNIEIHILFCIATKYAVNHITTTLTKYLASQQLENRFHFSVEVVQEIEDNISDSIKANTVLEKIISKDKYFIKKDIMTKSYEKGKHDKPYLGYNEGALPIVLSHNTPNNSLPILWQYSDSFKGLFPRISRH